MRQFGRHVSQLCHPAGRGSHRAGGRLHQRLPAAPRSIARWLDETAGQSPPRTVGQKLVVGLSGKLVTRHLSHVPTAMSAADATSALKEKFPQVTDRVSADHPAVNIPAADVPAILQYLRDAA